PQQEYLLTGTVVLDADFGSGSIATALSLSGTARSGSTTLVLPAIQGTAAIGAGSNTFLGTLTTTDNSFEGSVQGAFFGPSAQEFGYSFGINSPDKTRIGGGVAVGKQ